MSQAAAAAGAPSGASTGAGEVSGSDGAPQLDQKLGELREENTKLKSSFDNYRQETAADRELLKRLKSAFSPAEEKGKSRSEHLQGEFDQFLQRALELKARGQELPMTQQLAVNFYESQLESLKEIDALKAELAKVKGDTERANDPSAPVNNLAYTQMDTFLQQSLDQLYGNDQKAFASKKHMYNAVSSELAEHLKGMQRQAPGEWDQLRRSPGKMQSLVNDILRSIVPPKAMQLIEEQELKATPMTKGELWGAFREAQQLFQSAKTPEEKKKALDLQRSIRIDLQDLDAKERRRRR